MLHIYKNFVKFECTKGHSGPDNLKKSRPKKFVKSNKSISRIFFWSNSIFLQFQKWAKTNFWTGKKFRPPKNAISRKKYFLIYLISRFFLPGLFKIFWPAVIIFSSKKKKIYNLPVEVLISFDFWNELRQPVVTWVN